MSQTITQGRLRINANFKRFVDEEVLPGTGLEKRVMGGRKCRYRQDDDRARLCCQA